MNLEDLEARLRALLNGEFSSLSLSFNDGNGPNYVSVREEVETFPCDSDDWVSDEERERGMALNRKWKLHWYPDTPVGSYSMSASSLEALFAAVDREFPASS